MPRVTDIEMMDKNEQPVLCVRVRTPVQGLSALIGEHYGKIAALLAEQGVLPVDVPYVGFHNMDMQDLDVEIGFPVARPVAGRGDIQAGSIPAGKRIFCVYRGPYTGMEPAYAEMGAYMEKNKLKPTGMAYEYYFNGPGVPEEEYLTQIVMLVE